MPSEIADRYRKVAAQFTDRVRAVPDDAWDNPAPCEGWVARSVVQHLVEWVPALIFDSVGIERPNGPSIDTDPVGAWQALDEALQRSLDDRDLAAREFDMAIGRFSVENAIATFVHSDVLIHTWDLARATGLDETLDPGEVHLVFTAMEPMADILSGSGHFGPRVPVADDADEQTKLIALTGRTP